MSQEQPTPYSGEGETVGGTPRQERRQSGGGREDWPDHTDPEWLRYRYWVLGESMSEMGEAVGMTCGAIKYWMDKHGISALDGGKAMSLAKGGDERLWDEEWLREQYENRSSRQMATELGVHKNTVLDALKRFGIDTRTPAEARALAPERNTTDREYGDPRWLSHQYLRLGKSAREIADENGWGETAVYRALDRHGIPSRSRKAAMLLRRKREKCGTIPRERELVSADGIDASWRDIQDREQGCYIPYRDRQWMKQQVERGLSDAEIATKCGERFNCPVHRDTVGKWQRRLGIERGDE